MQSLQTNEQNMAKKIAELEAKINGMGPGGGTTNVNVANIQSELTAIKNMEGGFNAQILKINEQITAIHAQLRA